MRRPLFPNALLALALAAPGILAAAPPAFVYVGSYTHLEELPNHRNPPGAASRGIYAFRFDRDTGKLTPLGLAAETRNPTYVTFSPSGRFLYAANEIYQFQGRPGGAVSAFAVDPATGALSFLNQVASGGAGTCYVRTDHAGRNLLLANFGSGSVAVLPVNPDGSLRAASAFVQDTGSGPNPRQAGPHAHSFNPAPDDRFAVAAEFGTDRLMVYRFDSAAGTLRPADPPLVALAPASAPRHFTFHPDGRTAYALGEIDSSITVLAYDGASGRLRPEQTVSTLPADFKGKNTAAEVLVDRAGRFLYASNRGLNTIAVFAIDGAGRLRPVAQVPSGGRTPRGFCLDPAGGWLLAANQDTNNVAVFALDPATGIPAATGETAEVRSAECVQFLPAPR
jgi:6-phosphogluconolactonase